MILNFMQDSCFYTLKSCCFLRKEIKSTPIGAYTLSVCMCVFVRAGMCISVSLSLVYGMNAHGHKVCSKCNALNLQNQTLMNKEI